MFKLRVMSFIVVALLLVIFGLSYKLLKTTPESEEIASELQLGESEKKFHRDNGINHERITNHRNVEVNEESHSFEIKKEEDNNVIAISVEERSSDITKNMFSGITDFEKAYDEEDYDGNWASEILTNINDSILYKGGEYNFSALEIEYLDCKSTICRLEFRMVTEDSKLWDTQRSELLNSLLRMGLTDGVEKGRSIKTEFLEGGRIRYYISRISPL